MYDSTGKKHIRTKVVEENESFGIKVRDKATYYLKVAPQWGLSAIEDTLYLSSELMEPDAYENNDTWEEAKPLGKEPKSIRIEGETDEDWFKIETDQAGQTIQIDLRTDAGKFNKTRLEVYDDTLTRIAIEVAAEDVSFEVEAPKKGVYYLCVKNQYISDGPITDTLYINSNMAMPEAPIPPEIPQIPAEDQEINLPFTNIKDIEDQSDAVKVVTDVAKDLAASQKQDSDIIEQVTNFSEEAIAQVGTKEVSGDTIHITYDSIKALESAVLSTEEAVVGALRQQGVVTHREVDKAIKLKIDEVDKFTITVDPSMLDAQIDKMRIEAPEVEIAIHVEQLKAEGLEGQSLEVVVEKIALPEAREGMALQARSTVNSSAYQVSFNKPVLSQNISIALPKASGDTKYQAVFKDDQVVGGKYNPATNKVEVKSNQAGTYTVKENQKDFTDIQNKSQEMQEAIRVLASKGIINGKTTTTFAPDDRISRAEIATMIVKTVYKYDHTANAGFKDVKASDWYCAAVGSAKKAGIIDGYDDNTFRGNNTILKDQIIAITARVLRTEKHYKTPANVEQYLNYADRNTLAGWSLTDIALATRENLVVKRTDNKFMPQSSVTRGEAAIILKRLFDRI